MTTTFVTLLILITLFGCAFSGINSLNLRPIIGILAQPTSESTSKDSNKNSYIAASYVKYLESSGARVVPIPYDIPKDELRELLFSINGVLFPGGGTNLANTPYLQLQRDITEFSIERFRQNDYFPIWATCLGFEAIVIVTSKTGYSLMYNHFDSWNISMELNVEKDSKNSRLLNAMSSELYEAIQKEPLTMNNHVSGFRTEDFNKDELLSKFWKILSKNKDRKGIEFISTIESIDFPLYATQWHPEKNSFEWTIREGINHSPNAILVTQYFSNFFVQEARKSNHRFQSEVAENKALIYNFNPEFVYLSGSDFQQSYYFPKYSQISNIHI